MFVYWTLYVLVSALSTGALQSVFVYVSCCVFQLWFHNLTLRSAILKFEEPINASGDGGEYFILLT